MDYIYTTYKDFQENFDRDFEDFKGRFPNAELLDFLKELKELYQKFDRNTFLVITRKTTDSEETQEEWTIEKMVQQLWSTGLQFEKKVRTLDWYKTFSNANIYWWIVPEEVNNFFIRFLSLRDNGGIREIFFDEQNFKNNKYGLAKIQRDIQRRIDEIEEPAAEIESAEPIDDYSRENNQKPKIKLILLDKLGVIDAIAASLIDEGNVTHLAQVISAITGEEAKTLRTYINALRSYTNAEHNSPYNSEKTVQEAERLWDKLKLKNKDTGK